MTGAYPPGATPLTLEEEEDLIPSHISTRGELNAFEQANILLAETWLRQRRRKGPVVQAAFLKELHRRMFGETWKWAGAYRRSEKNIGIAWTLVSYQLEALCRDVAAWREYRSFSPDETVARFHHRLVAIHCFPNGNGRHARLAADLLAVEMKAERFTWGSGNLDASGDCRDRYIRSLKSADAGDIASLLAFARS